MYIQCLKAIYGLSQANSIAYKGLKADLLKHGYHETQTKCLFRHETDNISFIVQMILHAKSKMLRMCIL